MAPRPSDWDLGLPEMRFATIAIVGRANVGKSTLLNAALTEPLAIVSVRPQTVVLPLSGVEVRFEDGESIWTESSYKYEPEEVVDLVSSAGFAARGQWIDPEARFALTLFIAE